MAEQASNIRGGGRVPHASAGVREILVKSSHVQGLCGKIGEEEIKDRRQNGMKPGGILYGT
jgi:hypothetical protein